MKNKTLIITETHGDEKIGTNVIREITKTTRANFDWIIGNEEASKINKRFIELDLNRIAPGNIKSKKYEERRAAEMILISKQYDFVIDIHGADSKSGIFIIVTNPKIENIIFALTIPIKNIVIWSPKNNDAGPITKFIDCGVEIECGSKELKKTEKELKKIIIKINKSKTEFNQINFKEKNIFRVYEKLLTNENNKILKFNDFKKTKLNNEIFFPLLSGCYSGISCYKMKKLDLIDIFGY